MEIILLEKIDNLGNLGDMVKVRAGYARNYLVPQGKAQMATKTNLAEFEARRAELEAAAQSTLQKAETRRDQLEELEVTVYANAGQEGKLFGSVGSTEISDAISGTGIELKRKEVRLPDGPIRMIGEYDVELHLHADVNATIRVIVEAADADADADAED